MPLYLSQSNSEAASSVPARSESSINRNSLLPNFRTIKHSDEEEQKESRGPAVGYCRDLEVR